MFPEKIKSAMNRFVAQFLQSSSVDPEERENSLYWRCRNFRLLKGGFFPLSETLEMAAGYAEKWREDVNDYLLENAESNEPIRTDRNFDLSLIPQLLAMGQKEKNALHLANTRIDVVGGKDVPSQIERLLDDCDYMPEHGIFASVIDENGEKILISGVYKGYGDTVPLVALKSGDAKAMEKISKIFSNINAGEKNLKDAIMECMENMCALGSRRESPKP